MNLEELFLKRQSTRDYSDEEVTEEQLKEICRLAILAPSAINAQPYNLYAICGKKAKSFCTLVQVKGANSWASNCPAFIVIEARKPFAVTRGERTVTNAPFIGNDVGILAAYIALAAENMDIQTCIVGLRDESGIAKFLNLPDGTSFPLVIALGHKKEGYPVREKTRRDFNETVHIIK
ncbi:MAG: nitroreductase family protein [Clostridiales bacterium]|nr:nitroreductase family protein [Clostridiales bacterium]